MVPQDGRREVVIPPATLATMQASYSQMVCSGVWLSHSQGLFESSCVVTQLILGVLESGLY